MIKDVREILEKLGFTDVQESGPLDYSAKWEGRSCLIEVKTLSRVRKFAPITLSRNQYKLITTRPEVFILLLTPKSGLLLQKVTSFSHETEVAFELPRNHWPKKPRLLDKQNEKSFLRMFRQQIDIWIAELQELQDEISHL